MERRLDVCVADFGKLQQRAMTGVSTARHAGQQPLDFIRIEETKAGTLERAADAGHKIGGKSHICQINRLPPSGACPKVASGLSQGSVRSEQTVSLRYTFAFRGQDLVAMIAVEGKCDSQVRFQRTRELSDCAFHLHSNGRPGAAAILRGSFRVHTGSSRRPSPARGFFG